MSATILWLIAAVLVVVGIVQLIQGQILWGIVLIVLGCLVGPGGYSIFRGRNNVEPPSPRRSGKFASLQAAAWRERRGHATSRHSRLIVDAARRRCPPRPST